MKAASRLQRIHDAWDTNRPDLDDALTYNRKLWTVLVTSATRPENPLPREVKQNLANISVFVFNHTIDTMITPSAEMLLPLIRINHELAQGLRGKLSMDVLSTNASAA